MIAVEPGGAWSDRLSVGSIVVVRALALGDMLCAIPTFRAIRAHYPQARISLIALPWARSFVDRFPMYLDEHLEFPGFPGIPERPVDPARTVAFLAETQARAFDLAVQLQGDGSWINAFVGLLGARFRAGFFSEGWPESDRAGGAWLPYPDRGSEVERLLALPRYLGASVEPRLEFPVREADRAALAGNLREAGAATHLDDGAYAVVHPGASTIERRWPAARFAIVGDELVRLGLGVVLTGSANETGVTADVAASMRNRSVDLGGRTSLGAMAALVEGARVVVTNDTGVSHLAAALSTPSVVIFSGSDRDRWAPLDRRLHLALEARPARSGDARPIVSVDAVLRAVRRQVALDSSAAPRDAAELADTVGAQA